MKTVDTPAGTPGLAEAYRSAVISMMKQMDDERTLKRIYSLTVYLYLKDAKGQPAGKEETVA